MSLHPHRQNKRPSVHEFWQRLQMITPSLWKAQFDAELKKQSDENQSARFQQDFSRRLLSRLREIAITKVEHFEEWKIWIPLLKQCPAAKRVGIHNGLPFLLGLQVQLLREKVETMEKQRAEQPHDFDLERAFVGMIEELDPLEKAKRLAEIDAREQGAKRQDEARRAEMKLARAGAAKWWKDRDRPRFRPWATTWFEPKTCEEIRDALAVGRGTLGSFLKNFTPLNPQRPRNAPRQYPAEVGQAALLEWFKRPKWYRTREARRVYLLNTIDKGTRWEFERIGELVKILWPAIRSVHQDFGAISEQISEVILLAKPKPAVPLSGLGILGNSLGS